MINHTFKIQYLSEKDTKTLQNLNWKETFKDTIIIKSTYDIVMYNIFKYDVNFEKDNEKEIKTHIENSNHEHIKINKITFLRWKTHNSNVNTQSIIIHMNHSEKMNEYIENEIIIEHRIHMIERHISQCQIKQCFNCQRYDHKTNICKKKSKCDRCAKKHITRECNSEKLQCMHCRNEHEIWCQECSQQQREITQNEIMRDTTSTYYTHSY